MIRGFLRKFLTRLSSSPGGEFPEEWRAYARLARAAGLRRPTLFLSFDCDTDLDTEASRELHGFLGRLGIAFTLAVPGVQLLSGARTYGELAAAGVEYMNHGFLPHAAWQGERYIGTTFYNEFSPDEVRDDIRKGHAAVLDVTGKTPAGFRAPHFGSFQNPENLDLLHAEASALGCAYCSTTMPEKALTRGPGYPSHGLIEIPVLGSSRNPTTILDSWTYLTDRKNYALSDEYFTLFEETVSFMFEHDVPSLLTWYADPAHVVGQPPFERAMELVARRGIPSLTGSAAARLIAVGPGGPKEDV